MAGTGITIECKVDFPTAELAQEIKAEMMAMEPKLESAMNDVAFEAKEALIRHIQEDVYDAWSPKVYERRGASGGLISMESSLRESASAGRMEISYEPSGQQPQWNHPADGDAMISRIESGRGYEWSKHPGPRPFWQNFVDEMVDSAFSATFDRAMAAAFGSDYEAGATVEREPNDGDYDRAYTSTFYVRSENSNDWDFDESD